MHRIQDNAQPNLMLDGTNKPWTVKREYWRTFLQLIHIKLYLTIKL